jgi:ribosome-associated protein
MSRKKPLDKLITALEDMKAVDIRTIDVRKQTSITDMMIIATGRSNRQVRSLADKVLETAKASGLQVMGIEGQKDGEWVLVDLGDYVIHIMQPAVRDYYQLEKLWVPEPKKAKPRTRKKAADEED